MPRQPETTPEDVLDEFRKLDDSCEPLSAPEIAERLDISTPTAREKLKLAVDHGDLRSKRVGARALVFWVPCEN